jgi:hypothetical protein
MSQNVPVALVDPCTWVPSHHRPGLLLPIVDAVSW